MEESAPTPSIASLLSSAVDCIVAVLKASAPALSHVLHGSFSLSPCPVTIVRHRRSFSDAGNSFSQS
ncbi:hypothetical protein F0562_015448 [Nyssa sinensis]|uniref:Uncharacterized protein n=1 Tax=Nyssa sinensis TaxID=561372 RepID=A0A5J4ZJI8_9ASTE|nr:hypothetical protein F0562_015448 [Nyssa sinensis]